MVQAMNILYSQNKRRQLMELTELTTTLDALFPREIVSITNYKESLSYPNPDNTEITIDSTDYTPQRLCIVDKNGTIYLYVNTINQKYHKLAISNIESITT